MIEVRNAYSLGPNLSNAVFGQLLSSRFGFDFRGIRPSGFLTARPISTGETALAGQRVWQGNWPFERDTGSRVEESEFHIPPGNPVVLIGPAQRFDLISERREDIRRRWLAVENSRSKHADQELLICIGCGRHMADKAVKIVADDLATKRENAALRAASRLTEAEIRRLVAKVEHTELHWLVDDPDDPMLTRLEDLGGVVHCRGGMEDFRLIQSFQKVAIGQSAFQWWAAYLGHAKEIYFPPIDRGIWSHPEPADLITDP
jgi:hypothetical protein